MTTVAKFGIGKFKPSWLQCCANIKIFTVFYSVSALMTSTLSVYVASQITTLEKQFGFSSKQSGFLMSCNDIGFLTFTLFVSYFAEKAHIPRSLSLVTFLFGLSGIVCAIPYFVSPMYSSLNAHKIKSNSSSPELSFFTMMMSSDQLCEASDMRNESLSKASCSSTSQRQPTVGVASDFTPVAMAIIAIGMVCQGIAKSPRQAFLTIYIDNNVDKTQTAVYVGSIIAVAIFGPAIGFGLGGFFSQMYVTLEDVNISPRDPRWIGAWWLGFLTFGIGSIICSLPVMCFPRRFRDKPNIVENSMKEKRAVAVVRGFLKSILELLRNKLFVTIVVGKCIILIVVSGGIAFGPKYIETQFTLPAWKSNLLIGALRISSVSVGTFIGGYLTSRKKLTPLSCSKLIVVLSFVTLIFYILVVVIGCETPEIIGFNRKSTNASEHCTTSCNCDTEKYFPVCGSDNQNYFSPCHAGCTGRSLKGFTNCTCIDAIDSSAKPGLCPSNCPMLIPYMVITVVFGLVESISIMPGFIFQIRCVKDKDKGIAVAFLSFITTLLGWFLGPVIFGEIIDTCCKIWNTSCGVKGACALYDNVKFRLVICGFMLGLRCIVFVIDIIAFLMARKKTDWGGTETDYTDKKILSENGHTLLDKADINLEVIGEHSVTLINVRETDILT